MVSEWKNCLLGDVVEYANGSSFPNEFQGKKNGKYDFYKVSDMNNPKNSVFMTEAENTVDDETVTELKAKIHPKDTVIFPKVGAALLTNKRRILSKPSLFDNNIMGLKAKKSILPKYLYYFMHTIDFGKFVQSGAVPSINKMIVDNIPIKLPSLFEQRKIAAILSSVDEAIEKTEAIIEQTEKVKKGLMQQLLTKGIGHTKFKKTEIGEIPEEWEVVKINDIFERVTRNNDFKDNYPVLTISAKEGFVDQKERFNRVIAGKSLEKYVLLHKGEFAYNRGNSKSYPFGVTYKLNDFEKGLVPFVYFSFRKRNNIECNLDFYQYYFLSHKLDRQLRKIITSSARQDGLMNISADEFFNLLIPFPPKSEQEEIAKYIESVGKRIKRERKKFELLNLVKKALMQVLLTGKVRVKVEDEVMSQ